MPISSRWTIPLQVCSIPTYLFGPPGATVPDKPAFYDADRPDTHFLTIASFRTWSQRFAAGLQKAGLKPGDRVLLFSGNNLFYPVAFMGVLMAGGIFTGANPGFVVRELAYQLKDADAKFLICADASLEIGIEAATSVGMGKDRVFLFDDKLFEGTGESRLDIQNWKNLVESEKMGKSFRWFEPRDSKNSTCCLNYSSGTTGVPKGVEITHFNYVANATQFIHMGTLHPDFEAKAATAKVLCFLPMYHAMAQAIFISVAPKRQIPVYIMKKFDFVKVLESVQKFRITSLTMVPPVVVLLAKSPLTKKYDLSSVVDIGSGAAPLSGEVIEEAEALWPTGDRKMKASEGTPQRKYQSLMKMCQIARVGHDRSHLLTAWLGSPPGINPQLNGETEVALGERGEIWVNAPNIMKGYWRNPKATQEIFVDAPDGRWMRTGDIAYVDDKGHFFIVDRMKELIKVKGNQVAPAELEAVILEHPQIADSCVVGVTINGEEVPRAYIVPRQGEKPVESEIVNWMAKRVARHKRLLGGVVLVDAIPKNPSGKILRKILRERAKEEVGDKDPERAKL
ncbi:hypothetical protein BP6252_05557 [Coleophoma cylindrospora]|uniref:4-coumarate-CoA ligase n=1 Tax=Coleophoma cylindrospora TaxID=1849047 RepID=A0A3D8RUH3_9HELO|nr:hypothetical protein BP6252_05557 [Coleophoma cylindrospora]